jgi:hypothetical protein
MVSETQELLEPAVELGRELVVAAQPRAEGCDLPLQA